MKETLSSRTLLGMTVSLIAIAGILFIINTSAKQLEPTPSPTSQPPQQDRSLPGTVPAHTPLPAGDFVRLAWFYKPPEDEGLDQIAQNFDFYILTYKDEGDRDQLKSMGVTAPFAQYLLFLSINDPGGCDENPRGNQVAFKEGDFCMINEQHPDWFLLDQNGDRVMSGESSYFMDPGNEEFRRFWLERARELQETYGWDDLFLDNVEASRTKMVGDGINLANYPDDRSYQQAVEGFLQYIRQNYFEPRGKRIYGNIVSETNTQDWNRYLQHLDGVMIESFATDWDDGYRSEDEWNEQMQRVEIAQAQGKTLILVAQGEQDDIELQNFAFASYLLAADGKAVFRYTNADDYRELWLYENYNLDLGSPLGNRYQENGGWRRDFTNGHVFVHPGDEKAEITLNQ